MRDERRLTSRAYWMLLIMFVTLQIADIASTNYALAVPGVWEANPLMAFAQAELGVVWWLPKLAAAGVVSAAAFALKRRWPMVFAVSVSGLAVVANLIQC